MSPDLAYLFCLSKFFCRGNKWENLELFLDKPMVWLYSICAFRVIKEQQKAQKSATFDQFIITDYPVEISWEGRFYAKKFVGKAAKNKEIY